LRRLLGYMFLATSLSVSYERKELEQLMNSITRADVGLPN
jgi:hypothetical protein